jgi:excisionase family DNA binding protein
MPKTDVLSTRQVAQLLGVGEATIKRWADAGEIDCFRTPGGHRKFRLRDITGFVEGRKFQVQGTLPARLSPRSEGEEEGAVAEFQAAALAGNASLCVAQLAAHRLRGTSLAEIFDDLVAPALADMGQRWQSARLSVAEEHVGSQAVIDAIARAQPLAEPPGEPNRPTRGAAVVAAVAGELHDIAARMAACLLRARGYEVLAPLAQTPARDLADLVTRCRASIVALSSTMPRDPAELTEQIALAARAASQNGGRVVVGGKGMEQVDLPEGAERVQSMSELEQRLEVALSSP